MKKHLLRWGNLYYSILSCLAVVAYAMLHLIVYKIDWIKYETNRNYYVKISKLMSGGLMRISGNERQINSLFLISVFLIGFLIAFGIFIYAYRTFYARTYTPLLPMFGYLVPIFYAYGLSSNSITVLALCYPLIIVGGIISAAALKSLY
ncbi:hypothetical protein [Lactococcus sp.]|uniref:hypothetical protein n=1 Tax=Lactococcus sp. TaxID=44273 RepID=UPI0035B3DED9